MNPLPLQQLLEPGASTHALKSSLRPPSRLLWRIGCVATVQCQGLPKQVRSSGCIPTQAWLEQRFDHWVSLSHTRNAPFLWLYCLVGAPLLKFRFPGMACTWASMAWQLPRFRPNSEVLFQRREHPRRKRTEVCLVSIQTSKHRRRFRIFGAVVYQ